MCEYRTRARVNIIQSQNKTFTVSHTFTNILQSCSDLEADWPSGSLSQRIVDRLSYLGHGPVAVAI